MGSLRYSQLIEWFVTSELVAIREGKGWSRSRLGAAIGKHANTIRYWEIGERLPDKGNVALICRVLGVEPARAAFLEHVIEQLHQGPEVISDLDKRNLFIVEAAERTYDQIIKVEVSMFPGLLQTEACHMKLLLDPIDDPASKIKHWKRKERRYLTFKERLGHPEYLFVVPSIAFEDLYRLTEDEKDEQIQRLLEVDRMPNCEVRVLERPHILPHGFNIFRSNGRPGTGPTFAYVETIDQSRHIVEPENLALYDRFLSVVADDASRIGRFLDGRVHQLAEEHSE
jgi:transcriptional regulator with XRE-family HTH domain